MATPGSTSCHEVGAGEHTWSQAVYLNAGVTSGDRAARQVHKSLTA